MRIFSVLATRGNPKEPVPFQSILPLKLKPVVSGKGGKESDVCCLYEMSLMFACLKDNEFNESLCGKEVEGFQKCYTNHMKNKRLKEEKEAKGMLTPGDRNLSPKQINILLKRHPFTR